MINDLPVNLVLYDDLMKEKSFDSPGREEAFIDDALSSIASISSTPPSQRDGNDFLQLPTPKNTPKKTEKFENRVCVLRRGGLRLCYSVR